MEFFEELAMWHLTHNGDVFVCPQFSIGGGWSCPDFVALDFKHKTVSVVEVSAASSPGGLLQKTKDRHNQWLGPLKQQMHQLQALDTLWEKFNVVLYIREAAAPKFRKEIGSADDVEIRTLDEIDLPWNWEWIARKVAKEEDDAGAHGTVPVRA